MLFVCSLALAPAAVLAAPPVRLSVGAGFSGWIVPDVWIPIRVDVASDVPLEGSLYLQIGPARYRRTVTVPAGATQRITVYAVIPDPRRPLGVTLRDSAGAVVAEETTPVPRERIVSGVVLALTAEAAGLEFLSGGIRRRAAAYVTERDLPDHWAGYEGVDLVVLRDVDERETTDRQRRALQQWVAQGGRLLLTGERLLRRDYPWLRDLLPADVLPRSGRTAAGVLPGLSPQPIAVLRPRPGAAAQPRTGLPVSVSRPYGRGLVTVWAVDAFAPAVRAWPGRIAWWRQVVPTARLQPVARPDLTDVIPTSRTLSGLAQVQIIGLSLAYVLLVRFVLRHYAPRTGGWLVLAGVVAVFAVALYATAASSRRAASAVVQVSVVEATGAANLARVTTYVAMLQPYGGPYVLTAPDDALVRPLTPMALTETAGTLSGEAAAGTILFEAVGMVAMPIGGRAVSTGAGLELTIDNQSGLRLSAPAVYLNGQMHALPDVAAGRVTLMLTPAEWSPPDRNAATGDFTRDARAWMGARLDGYTAPAIIGYKTLWLLGEVRDSRLAVHLQRSDGQRRVELVLSPISMSGGGR